MFNVKHTIALATVILSAFLAPVATAQPVDPPIPAATSTPHVAAGLQGVPVANRDSGTTPATVAVTQGGEGFQWGDAALGAAAMLAGLGIGAALLLSAKRGRERDRTVAAS